jgi:tRNA(His) 5'-end guanylyltransferase
MKEYEYVERKYLTKRVPVIIRIDGKAFHTYTRGMDNPFDSNFHNTMIHTARYLCENIQGCMLAYTQSDEISLLLTDYKTIKTEPWFDYNVQKLTSVSASLATARFNSIIPVENNGLAMFDSRVFNLPKDEVCNYFLWRQRDAERNSIQSLGQEYFSHKQLQGKSNSDVQDMLMLEMDVNWNELRTWKKRGSCVVKVERTINEDRIRTTWVEDIETPIFSKDRDYINEYVFIRED